MDPFAARSLCGIGFSGMPRPKWDNTSNFNAPSLNQEPGKGTVIVKVQNYVRLFPNDFTYPKCNLYYFLFLQVWYVKVEEANFESSGIFYVGLMIGLSGSKLLLFNGAFSGVAFPNKIVSPLSEPVSGNDYTIEKKLASANKRIAEAENEDVVLNDSKGPSVTDQVGRGANAQNAILAAFQHPVFNTTSDIHLPAKRAFASKRQSVNKKSKILQKLQIE